MKAINVKGVETLKHYPKEPMTIQEGHLTEAQIQELITRNTRLITRLHKSTADLQRRIDPYAGVVHGTWSERDAINHQALINMNKLLHRENERLLNERIGTDELRKMREMLDRTYTQQMAMFEK